MDQAETWHRGRARPGAHCIGWRPSSASSKGAQPPFSAHVCCGQTAGWIKVPLGTGVYMDPGDIVLDGHLAPPAKKRAQYPSNFGPCIVCIVAKWLHGSRSHLARGKPRPRPHCVTWRPSSSPLKGGTAAPPNFRPMSAVAKRLDGSKCHLEGR